jgi:hypothetical protein
MSTSVTPEIGDLDLLGEVRGVGHYEDVLAGSITVELFDYRFAVIDICKLILAKRAAPRSSRALLCAAHADLIEVAQKISRIVIDSVSAGSLQFLTAVAAG